jgi:predicted metal-dependent enzyme (double-stranded beta helix superfamily)
MGAPAWRKSDRPFGVDPTPERRLVAFRRASAERETRHVAWRLAAADASAVGLAIGTILDRQQAANITDKGKPAVTITRSSTYDLTTLVADLDLAVRSTRGNDPETVEAVCSALAPALSSPDLLLPGHRIGDPAGYRSHLLHVAPDGAFSLVALVWLPGQATAIHDHLSWCVVGVYEGAEHETLFRPTPPGHLVASGSAIGYPGDVAGLLPPGDIHRVHNTADTIGGATGLAGPRTPPSGPGSPCRSTAKACPMEA